MGPIALPMRHEFNGIGGKPSHLNNGANFPPLRPILSLSCGSATDDLALLQAKVQEYREAGVLLGWLINPQ